MTDWCSPFDDGEVKTLNKGTKGGFLLHREALFFFLKHTMIPLFIREVMQRKKITILYYHNPDPSTLDLHIGLLRKRYSIISLRDFTNAIKSKRLSDLPPKSLIITFDDGHKNNYELLPVFKKHGVTPTIFLCTGLVGTNRHFWFIDSFGRLDVERLKMVPDAERKEMLRGMGFSEEMEYEARQALSAPEINEMKDTVDFQSHTLFHPSLPRCSEEDAMNEIRNSKLDLMDRFGIAVNALSYPNGDYSTSIIEMVRSSGYECGVTADLGFNDIDVDPFRLKRIGMRDGGGANEVVVRATGLYDALRNIIKPRRFGFVEND